MSVGGEFGRRMSDDELCAEVRQAVEDGDEDALRRLGFGGFAEYAQRLSELMSDSVTDGLDLSAEDFAAIMGEVASPARYAHHLVNEAGTAVQRAKDEPLGIHMKPIEPDFDDDALCGTVGKAASMDTPEQTVATLAEGLAYAVKKTGNDFIKANAEQRSRAGFEVKVKRSGSTKCCPWCAARIGSWAIANAPDGVFGCHANCSCTVEYTSSTGAKTSASGANLNRLGVGAFTEIEYQPPHVMTHEEAKEKGGFDEPKRLTGGANGGIIGYNDILTSSKPVAHDAEKYVPLLDIFGADSSTDPKEKLRLNQLNFLHQKRSQALLKYAREDGAAPGTEYAMIYNAKMNKFSDRKEHRRGIFGSVEIEGSKAQPNEFFHAFHNHGSSETLGFSDLRGFSQDHFMKSLTAQGNNGVNKFTVLKTDSYDEDQYRLFITEKSVEVFYKIGDRNITLNDFLIEKDKKEIEELANTLSNTEKEEFQKALLEKTLECLTGGEKYGVKYISSKT